MYILHHFEAGCQSISLVMMQNEAIVARFCFSEVVFPTVKKTVAGYNSNFKTMKKPRLRQQVTQ